MLLGSVPDSKINITDMDPLNEDQEFQIQIQILPQIVHDEKKC